MTWLKARVALAALALAVSATACLAQYPSRMIKIISPAPPGGSTDIVARLVQPGLQELLKQIVIVESRGGAVGHIGSPALSHGPPEGVKQLFAPPLPTPPAATPENPTINTTPNLP